jgi:hypothetical protein
MANKKISELPIVVDNIYKLSDNDVVAMVSASTTAQITIKTLRDKITEFAAKTGSANTFTGNQIVNGSVTITGKLTVNDIETIYQTSSVVFSSGSNKFGDQSSDKHEFTGSVNMTGSLIVNGDSVNIATLNQFTSSQLGVNLGTSIVTASFNSFSSSQLGVNLGNSIVTASFNSFSSSQLGVNLGTSIVTASFNSFSSSQLGVNLGTSIVTASFNSFSSSQLGVNLGVSIVTASFNQHSQSISDTVANIQAYTASVKVEVGQLVSYTASLNTFTASGKIDVANIQAYTASVKEEISQTLAYTASVKETISQTLAYTASVKNEVANIQAYTASVKNEVANIQAYTASVKETISQTLAYTASVKNEVANIQAYTASVKETISQTLAYTASVKTEIGQIVAYTSSLNVFTSSAKLDITGIQSYTQSLKTSGIVSSSQQIKDYFTFAQTSSANTFYGNQTITGNLNLSGASPLLYNAGTTNAMLFGFFDGGSIYGPYYQIFGNSYSSTNQRGSAEFVFDSRNGGFSGFNVAEFNGSTWLRKFRVSLTGAEVTGSFYVTNNIEVPSLTGSLLATNGVVSSSSQITELTQIGPLQGYTASLKNAFTIDGNNDVYFTGKITTQELHTTYTTSSVLFQSGSTKFGNTSDDRHEFTGSLLVSHSFEVIESSTGATKGDFFVDSPNKYVYVGRQSPTSGDNTIFVVRDRTNTPRATIPGGGSIDTVFSTNNSNFRVTNYSGTNLLNVSNAGNVTASGTFNVGGKTQIGTSTTDTSLGSNTKFSVVGDGSVNAGASQGSLFVAAGNEGGDTGLPINMGTAGATLLLLASINTSTGTATNSATYIVRFYFDGNNAPTTNYLGGSSDFVTFGVTPSNTLAVSGSSSGNKSYAWFINKFGA